MRSILAVFLMTCWTSAPLAEELRWRETTYADFADGTFGDGGANLYVSFRGRVETIARWDLNGDGYIDLTFANSHPHAEKLDAVIYWGNGKNFDISRVSYVPNNGSQWMVPADVNGDDHLDLLVPNYQNGTHDKMDSYVYLHEAIPRPGVRDYKKGDLFPVDQRISLPTQAAQHAAAADLNRDGYVDVVFAFSGGFWEYRENPWVPYQAPSRIYWGSAGGFSRERFTEIPTLAASAVAIADLNRDGWPDLILPSHESKESKDVDSHVYWGGPQGFSASPRTALPTRGANMVRVADVNGDGKLDLVFANGEGDKSYIYLGDGKSFTPSRRWELETHDARDCQITDVNRDGFPDIFFSNHQRGGNRLTFSYLYLGSAKGFSNDRRVEFETVGAWGSALTDLNEDGWPDLAVSSFQEYNYFDVSSYIYWNSPSGFDLMRRTPLFTHGATGVSVADFNEDGHADILISNTTAGYRGNYHPISVYWGNPTGDFSPTRRTFLPSVDVYEVRAADFNDDGYPDLLAANSGENGRNRQESYIYWGSATGFSTENRTGLMSSFTLGAGLGDLDRNGYLDVIIGNFGAIGDEAMGSYIYWGGPEGFSPLARTAVPTDGGEMSVVADFNKDSHLDILFGGERADRGAVIYWGDGTRNYSRERRTFIPGSQGSWSPDAADLNGDGYLDLILPRSGYIAGRSTTSYIYWGNARGEYSEKSRLELVTVGAGQPTAADLNQDGWLDLVFPAYSTGTSRNTMSRIFWGGPEGYSEKRMLLLPTYGGTGALANDFNRDGWMDLLLVCHRSEGDPDRMGVFGEHITKSFLYWGGPEGFTPDRRLEIPTEGAHYDTGVDMGNIYDRRYGFDYISSPYSCGSRRPVKLSWKGETPRGSKLLFQLRVAKTSQELARAPWMGPQGENTYYEFPDATIKDLQGPWIQYRALFTSPDGVSYPVLDEVGMVFE